MKIKQIAVLLAGWLLVASLQAAGLIDAQVTSVSLNEDTAIGQTWVEVGVDQALDATLQCTDDKLSFIYDKLGDPIDDNSASLFMYSLLLTAKSTGSAVSIGYRDSCSTVDSVTVCTDQCVVTSVRMAR